MKSDEVIVTNRSLQVRPRGVRHPQQVGHAADLREARALQGPPPQDGQQALLLLRTAQDQGVPPRRTGRTAQFSTCCKGNLGHFFWRGVDFFSSTVQTLLLLVEPSAWASWPRPLSAPAVPMALSNEHPYNHLIETFVLILKSFLHIS